MKALTIWQPWGSLIIAGAKPYEFRRWPAPRFVRGQRIVIHAGARPVSTAEVRAVILRILRGGDDLHSEIAMPILERVRHEPKCLPLAAGLGTALLGEPSRATVLFPNDPDADPNIWGWPLTDIEPFEPMIPARGAQGFWNWGKS